MKKAVIEAIPTAAVKAGRGKQATQFSLAEGRAKREQNGDGERGIGRSKVGTQFVGRVWRDSRAQSTATGGSVHSNRRV